MDVLTPINNDQSKNMSHLSASEDSAKHLKQVDEHPLLNSFINGKSHESLPLIEVESINPKPPLAESETDLEVDDRDTVNEIQPGVDDGFFIHDRFDGDPNDPAASKPPDVPPVNERQPDAIDGKTVHGPQLPPDYYGRFPYAPSFGPYDPEAAHSLNPTDLESIPDVNVYQHKKTLAQGMMDLALFSANANQLRYVVESFSRHPYYYPSIILISISLLFQVSYEFTFI